MPHGGIHFYYESGIRFQLVNRHQLREILEKKTNFFGDLDQDSCLFVMLGH
jgi:hypothetical protein